MGKARFALQEFDYRLTFVNGEQSKSFSKEELAYYGDILSDIIGRTPKDTDGRILRESIVYCEMDREKNFTWEACRGKQKVQRVILSRFDKRVHQYIGANSYTAKVFMRDEEHVFALKNIVLDIDFHEQEEEDCIYGTVQKANALLEWVRTSGKVPVPNLVCFTGRGVQLWYFLQPCAKPLAFIYKAVSKELCSIIDSHFGKEGYKVDTPASCGANRIFRIPGTYNPNAHIFSQCVRLHGTHVPVQDLQGALQITFPKKENIGAKNSGSSSQNTKKKKPGTSFTSIEQDPCSLYRRRCWIIKQIIKSGRPVESRENLLFLYHNFAMNIPGSKEVEEVFALNQLFPQPLKDREIWALIKCNIKKKGYSYQDAAFFEKADMTADEIQAYYAYKGTVHKNKNRARDTRRKEKKVELVSKIQRLYRYGRTKKYKDMPVLSVKEIAKKAGCSANTVYKYTKAIQQGIDRENRYKEICRQLRVFRKMKKEERDSLLKEKENYDKKEWFSKYLAVRAQHEAVQYACNVLASQKKNSRPGSKEMEALYAIALSIVQGESDDIPALVRVGIKVDKYHKVKFCTKDKKIANRLYAMFHGKMKGYILYEESHWKEEQQRQEKQQKDKERVEKIREDLYKRQERIANQFIQSLEDRQVVLKSRRAS